MMRQRPGIAAEPHVSERDAISDLLALDVIPVSVEIKRELVTWQARCVR